MSVSPIQGIVYGFVQGLTEFLPISSSAHLVLVPWFFGWTDQGLSFDVALHAGTLLAVLWYFWRDWWQLLDGLVRSLRGGQLAANPEAELFWKIAVASVPAVVVGFAIGEEMERSLRAPALIATTLALFSLLLFWSDRFPSTRRGLETIGWREALWVGLAQAAALVPGVSRSGVTITAARFLDVDRETAARFSFLMSTPVVAGAAVLRAEGFAAAAGDPGQLLALAASAAFGFLAIGGLVRYVRTRSYTPFVIYRLVLAFVILLVAASR